MILFGALLGFALVPTIEISALDGYESGSGSSCANINPSSGWNLRSDGGCYSFFTTSYYSEAPYNPAATQYLTFKLSCSSPFSGTLNLYSDTCQTLVKTVPIPSVCFEASDTSFFVAFDCSIPSWTPTKSPSTSAPTPAPSMSPNTSKPSESPTTSNPTTSPSKAQSTSAPTEAPSTSPSTSKPSASPTSSKPTTSPSKAPSTSVPTISPSHSPTVSAPTNSPTFSPTTSPSTVPTSVQLSLTCRPRLGTTESECTDQITLCASSANIPMKWAGTGCTDKKGRASDGGCQCIGYCGYKCKQACAHDPECKWDAKKKACFNRSTGRQGKPIPKCIQATG